MKSRTEEWLKQAEFDMDTADYMLQGGRTVYAVFMCHLAVEKALKGLYHGKRAELPPRTHSLVFLLNEIGVRPPEELGRFIVRLSEAGVTTRYPEDLAEVQRVFTTAIVGDILATGREVMSWIKKQL